MGIDIVLLFFYFSFALINTGDAFCLSHSRSTTPSSQMEMGRKSRSSDGVIARSTKNPSSDESFEETQPSRSRRKKVKQKTFTRFVEIESWRSPEMQEMAPLLLGLGNGCKLISDLIKRSSSDGNLGLFGEMNIQGEDQKKLDVVSNTILKTMLCSTGILFGVASEEEDYVQACEDVCDNLAFSEGQFGVVFDPLDGSSNVDAGLPVGTIFGVYRKQSVDQSGQEALMQRGRQTVAAGYCLYGAATILVISTGNGVNGFTLDTKKGQFILTYPDMRIPQRGNTYYFNEANSLTWSPGIQSWIRTIKQGLGETGEQYRQIYMGALVADLHQLMLAGGVFGYPADARNPRGKLRLLYEGNPISYLIEQAGGVSVVGSSSGPQRVLDIEPLELHQREPLIFGSREDIYELYTHLEKED
mmetsp:Transcript_15861/g.28060  ORF Transcript_15861/g.28060 Transcript_15861/m.28060 type:complete len:415 (-) Transcript_15861:371-1615(-)